jgi:hypothetical protein
LLGHPATHASRRSRPTRRRSVLMIAPRKVVRYLGASKAIKPAGSPLGSGAVLGVVDRTSVLIETIPQSSNSHSVAADSEHNYIFVPQVCTATGTTCKIGGDTNTTAGSGSPTVGQQICGTTNGCVAVYEHKVDHDEDRDDRRAER